MESIPKQPQEVAAQLIDAYPYFETDYLPEPQKAILKENSIKLKAELTDVDIRDYTDADLESLVGSVIDRAKKSGVWDPTKGDDASVSLRHASDRLKTFGFSEESASIEAPRTLSKFGMLSAMRFLRKERELKFKRPTNEFIETHFIDAAKEKQEIDELLRESIDLSTITSLETQRVKEDFPSGNFLYHGAEATEVVKILGSGAIVNADVLLRRSEDEAKNGGEKKSVRRNSGLEGISWSMNSIDALPGDRYHLAGFVGAPEKILSKTGQLVVPSRPAVYEVLQIQGEINANEFFEAKTQLELYSRGGMIGEANSVMNNLTTLNTAKTKTSNDGQLAPMLISAQDGILANPNYQKILRDLYKINSDNSIYIDPDLVQQPKDEIPIAAVWLQGMIDSGRLKDTPLDGLDVVGIINGVDDESYLLLIRELKKDLKNIQEVIENSSSKMEDVEVPVEDLYFVAPRKDAHTWLKVLVRSGHKPKGIFLYDDKKVRLENFASSHQGNHAELTLELQAAIKPGSEGYIQYKDVLGAEVTNDMRTGRAQNVVAERHLRNRKKIVKEDDVLVVK